MSDFFTNYRKKKEYLICVDSGGCVMNSMEIVHSRCFGPCLLAEWELNAWRSELLARWQEINVTSLTRGINRFRALCLLLQEVHRDYCPIEDLDSLVKWTETDPELSDRSLEQSVQETGSTCLRKALCWSRASDQAIRRLSAEEKPPFDGVKQALARAHRYADVAVLSGANLRAVLDEWDLCGLLEHTDLVMAQDLGSKGNCLRALLTKGYAPSRAILIGDTVEDLEAAEAGGVWFFPVLAGHEVESWENFSGTGLSALLNGTCTREWQQAEICRFRANLTDSEADSKSKPLSAKEEILCG